MSSQEHIITSEKSLCRWRCINQENTPIAPIWSKSRKRQIIHESTIETQNRRPSNTRNHWQHKCLICQNNQTPSCDETNQKDPIIVDQTNGASNWWWQFTKAQEDFDLLRYESFIPGTTYCRPCGQTWDVDVKSLHDLYTASIQNQPISTASAEDNNQLCFSWQ